MKRFARLMWCDLSGNRKGLLRLFAIGLCANFAALSAALLKPSIEGGDAEMSVDNAVSIILFVCMIFIFFFAPSHTFSHLKTRSQRTAQLMIPAAQGEKYLVRLLQAVVLWPLLFLVSIVVADGVRMLLFPLLGHRLPAAFPDVFLAIAHSVREIFSLCTFASFPIQHVTDEEVSSSCCSMWLFLLATGVILSLHAFFLLGGSVFRRRPLLKTAICFLGLNLVLVVITSLFPIRFSFDSAEYVLPVVAVVPWIITLLCHYLSFRRFTRIQVISRKWL